MNSYLDLVKEYGKVHRQKNRITIICIAIAVCLVTGIFGLADMEIRAQYIGQIKSNGNYHISIKNIDSETAKLIGSRVDVAVSGWIQSVSGSAGYTIHEKPIALVGSDEAIAREMGLILKDGHYPRKSDEALLDQPAMKQFSLAIGDKTAITTPDGRVKHYIVVGTFSDFASLKTDDVHGLALSDTGLKQMVGLNRDGSRYYVQFRKGANMRKAIDDIKVTHHLENRQVSENAVLLAMSGQSRDNWMMQLYFMAAVLFVLVLTAGVLMIASSFNMSVLERIQFFGMLRCLGASKKQVKRLVLLEAIRLSLKGIPFGLLAGTVVVWMACTFLKYVNPAYFSDMPLFGVSWISLIFGVIVGFLTVILASLSPCKKAAQVSPISAVTGNINQTNIPQSPTAVKTMHAKVEIVMGIHHALASKKNLLLMIGSFAVSIILFLSFSIMVNFMYQAVRPLKPYTPDISVISGDNTTSLPTNLLTQISHNGKVHRAYGRMFAYDVPAKDGKINLISYEKNQFGWAEEHLIKGRLVDVQNGLDSVLVVYADDLRWKVGDLITLKLPSGERKVKIAGVLSHSPFSRTPGTQTVICSEMAFTRLIGNQGYTIIDIQLAKGADDETVWQIRSLLTPQMQLSDRRQSNSEAKAAFYSFAIFVYGFLLIIGSITVFNIINTMNIGVAARISQYGIMRAVGMSGDQLHRMVTAEAFTYAACGCIVGCILGLPLHHCLFQSVITSHWGIPWQPPLVALAIIVGLSLLTTILSIIGPVKKINDMDIVNVVTAL